ncbi:MAG: hypothetical protein ACI8Q9_002033, partial [Planctomycetota bacterium]
MKQSQSSLLWFSTKTASVAPPVGDVALISCLSQPDGDKASLSPPQDSHQNEKLSASFASRPNTIMNQTSPSKRTRTTFGATLASMVLLAGISACGGGSSATPSGG